MLLSALWLSAVLSSADLATVFLSCIIVRLTFAPKRVGCLKRKTVVINAFHSAVESHCVHPLTVNFSHLLHKCWMNVSKFVFLNSHIVHIRFQSLHTRSNPGWRSYSRKILGTFQLIYLLKGSLLITIKKNCHVVAIDRKSDHLKCLILLVHHLTYSYKLLFKPTHGFMQ